MKISLPYSITTQLDDNARLIILRICSDSFSAGMTGGKHPDHLIGACLAYGIYPIEVENDVSESFHPVKYTLCL